MTRDETLTAEEVEGKKNTEMKERYSKFIADVSDILGLGKPIDILKLCATTDRFFTPLQKQIQIDAEQIRALQKQNGELTDELTLTNNECKDMREELKQRIRENQKLCEQIEKMKKYIKACWVEENLNDYSSYMTNSSDEFRDLVHELNEEIRNGR